jgi:hypothetical protein
LQVFYEIVGIGLSVAYWRISARLQYGCSKRVLRERVPRSPLEVTALSRGSISM